MSDMASACSLVLEKLSRADGYRVTESGHPGPVYVSFHYIAIREGIKCLEEIVFIHKRNVSKGEHFLEFSLSRKLTVKCYSAQTSECHVSSSLGVLEINP